MEDPPPSDRCDALITALQRLLLLPPVDDVNEDRDDDWPPPLLAALKLLDERDPDLPKATRLMTPPLPRLGEAVDKDDPPIDGAFSATGMISRLLTLSDEADMSNCSCRRCCCCWWRLREKAAGSILPRT